MSPASMKRPVEAGKRGLKSITKRDLTAGVTNAVTNIPDAMANAVLAGVNPIQGLYAIMVGTPAASLTTGSQLMTVAVTGSIALIVGDSLHGVPSSEKTALLIVLTLLVGLVQIVLGLARTGALVRFVSNAVLRGFILGVAVNIILSQIPRLTGYESDATGKVVRALDTLLHPTRIDPRVFAVGIATILVALLVEKTRAKDFSFLVALLVSVLGVWALGWEVPTVKSLAEIPAVLPRITLPSVSLVASMLVPAVSIAIVGLIQGAGVSKGIPNRDGSYPDMNRDFVGQGVGNAISGLFGGMPIGGSVSSTALLVQLGARSRIANFLVGPIIALVVLFLSDAVEMIPLSTLAALLVIVGVRAIDVSGVQTVWQTSLPSRTIMAATFIAMLVVPVQYAVLLGVALSVVQHVYSASLDVRVVALVRQPDGSYAEEQPPSTLADNEVTILDIYGSVFYAGAEVIGGLLPKATGSHRPAVVLRMRGRTDVGSTFLTMLERYRAEIDKAGGILLLSGVGPELKSQLARTGALSAIGADRVCEAKPTLMASLSVAVEAAEQWLREQSA